MVGDTITLKPKHESMLNILTGGRASTDAITRPLQRLRTVNVNA